MTKLLPFCNRISVVVEWFDLWMGFYYDQKHGMLYVMILPCLGLAIRLIGRDKWFRTTLKPERRRNEGKV